MTNCTPISISIRAFEMYTKSIRTALDVIIIVCHVMPFVWEKSVAFFGLDP